jgi:hypothetical protein
MENMTLNDMLQNALEYKISVLEIKNYIEKITNNYELVKTYELRRIVNHFIQDQKAIYQNNTIKQYGHVTLFSKLIEPNQNEFSDDISTDINRNEINISWKPKSDLHDAKDKLKRDHKTLEDFYKKEFSRLYNIIDFLDEKINTNPNESKGIQHPFKDEKTYKYFNYLIENWDYTKDLKYSYIYEHIESLQNKSEYEKFIKLKYTFLGKFQYEHAISKKVYAELLGHKNTFNEKYT